MQYICTNCGTIVEEGTRWCPNREKNCPPGTFSRLFNAGDTFDQFAIQKRLTIFRTAVLYQAKRGNEIVFLKIAHLNHEDRLKAEALLLMKTDPHPALPKLVTAAINEQRPYGKFTFSGEVKYFMVYQWVAGQFLREVMEQNPYFSPHIAGWLSISLADVVAFLHIKYNKLLLNLTPDNILVRKDKQGILRPLLLDFGWMSEPSLVKNPWFQSAWQSNYLAPEQVNQSASSPSTDVYALGLLLYEMLAGQQAFSSQTRHDSEVRTAVLSGLSIPLAQLRPELPQGLTGLVAQALQVESGKRQSDMRTFAKGLRTLLGEVPAEQRRIQIDRRIIAILVFAGLVMLLILILWLLTTH